MAFVKKTWKDRMVEYAGRRKITNTVTNESQIVDVERAEGQISEEGSAFSAANMNDLEQRVADEFSKLNKNMKFPDNVGFYPDIKDGVRGYNTDAARGADTFFPFSNAEIYIAGAINYYSNGAYAHNCGWGVTFNPYNLKVVSEGSDKAGDSGYAYVTLPKGRYNIALSTIDKSANAYLQINSENIVNQNNKAVVTLEDSTDTYFYINKASAGSVTVVIAIEKL